MEAFSFERGFGYLVVLDAQNDVSMSFGARHKGIKILDVYFVFVKHTESFGKLCLRFYDEEEVNRKLLSLFE